MKTPSFKDILAKHGLTVLTASKKSGILYQCIYQHARGFRKVSAEDAVKYENLLGIPRNEIRPDLWPAERPQ